MEETLDILREFFEDHKTTIFVITGIILAAIIGYIIFSMVYNPVKISISGDGATVYATRKESLQFEAKAYDKTKSDYPIKWEVSEGTLIESQGGTTTWELPKQAGVYSISAISGDAKSTKYISVLKNVILDTLVGNDNVLTDNDFDGLTDDYEMTISKTDPKLADTDEDGLLDGNEVMLTLNPLQKDSENDGIQDNNRNMEYTIEQKDVNASIHVKGKGNIISTSVNTYSPSSLNNIAGVVSPLYDVFSEANEIDNMTLRVSYDKTKVKEGNVQESNLSFYRLIEETDEFEKISSVVETTNGTVSADIKKNGKYFVANTLAIPKDMKTEIMFVIDNSGSMYSKEEVADSAENDVDFKRVIATNNLIDGLKGDYMFGAGKFTFEYTKLADFTNNKETVKKQISTIMTEPERFTGTNIGEALYHGVQQFNDTTATNTRRCLVLLTDGKDTTDVEGYDAKRLQQAIDIANKKSIKVYTIGLGSEIDPKNLQEIATKTKGDYYYAYNDKELDTVFVQLSASINYNRIQIEKEDGVLLKDSGFNPIQNGFSFDNIPLSTDISGNMYGMSLFAKLHYEGKLPNTMKDISIRNTSAGEMITAKGYANIPVNSESGLASYRMPGLEFLSEKPYDFFASTIRKGLLTITTEYQTQLENNNLAVYQQEYQVKNASFKEYQNYMITIDSDTTVETTTPVIFNPIFRLDILKYKDSKISFQDRPKEALDYLEKSLSNHSPVLLNLNDSYTVLASKMIQSVKDPSIKLLEVYDPNLSGEIRYVAVKSIQKYVKGDKASTTNTPEYSYVFQYNGVNVSATISIPNVAENL